MAGHLYLALLAVLRLVTTAVTAYEAAEALEALYEGIDAYENSLKSAKEAVKAQIESLQDEIGNGIDYAVILSLTEADEKLQSEMTKRVNGRTGENGDLIRKAIPMNIPFRDAISLICAQADKVPVFALRKRAGVKVSDLPKIKQRVLAEILGRTAEELDLIEDIDLFIPVQLRQLMVGLLIEFIDEVLDWRSPIKAEACFGPGPQFADPPLQGTRLVRSGPAINPFYPLPHRQRGTIAADLAIPDYRGEPLTKDNLFAVVEIKFEGDPIKNKQFENYEELNKKCAETKTVVVGKGRTAGGKGVTIGCRVSLFRYPEDVAVKKDKNDKNDKNGNDSKDSKDKPTGRKPGLTKKR